MPGREAFHALYSKFASVELLRESSTTENVSFFEEKLATVKLIVSGIADPLKV